MRARDSGGGSTALGLRRAAAALDGANCDNQEIKRENRKKHRRRRPGATNNSWPREPAPPTRPATANEFIHPNVLTSFTFGLLLVWLLLVQAGVAFDLEPSDESSPAQVNTAQGTQEAHTLAPNRRLGSAAVAKLHAEMKPNSANMEQDSQEREQAKKSSAFEASARLAAQSAAQSAQFKLPPGATCTMWPQQMAPTSSQRGQDGKQPETNSSGPGQQVQMPPFKLFKLSSTGLAKSKQPADLSASSIYFNVPPSNNSVRLLYLDHTIAQQKQVASLAPSQLQMLAFETVCGGWRNSLVAGSQRQPAYWVLDRRRGALVAKFDYFSRDEFLELDGHEAKLISPPFPPLPAYHFMPQSRFGSSCRVSFRSYVTLRAHLELSFVPIASMSANSANKSAAASIKQDGQSSPLAKVIDEKWGQRQADMEGEAAAWRTHDFPMPQSLELRRTYYRLEFSAIPSTIRKDSTHQYGYLNGVAIANFSLSPQCFGLGVDEATIEQVRRLTGLEIQVYSAGSAAFSSAADDASEQLQLEQADQLISLATLKLLLESHKTSILIGVIFVLVTILFVSQWLLCTYLVHGTPNAADANSARHKKSPWCCCLGTDRRRVYVTSANGQHSSSKAQYLNGKLAAAHNQFTLDQQRNNYLRPLSAAILGDNVELLNVNPSYVPNQAMGSPGGMVPRNSSFLGALIANESQQLRNNPLESYFIDRKRLTVTKTIGRGAFGEVYQGYLVCRYSDDGTKPLTNEAQDQEQDDSLESHSMKVALKTFSDEKMSKKDFILEAINMSQVSHRNIVDFIGVCFEKEPLFIVMEFMAGGNLKNFLLGSRDKVHYDTPSLASNENSPLQNELVEDDSNPNRLFMGDLLVFALDIARACDYLQRHSFIHRDLAARNCLLTSSVKQNHQQHSAAIQTGTSSSYNIAQHATSLSPLIPNIEQADQTANSRHSLRSFIGAPPSAMDVAANHKVDLDQVYLDGYMGSSIVAKLADFGMTRDVYSNNYYRMGHKELPVRWMPPECLDGVATTKSDVWSFGVFLWELFSMGQLPYQNLLDNQQVIEFIKSRRHVQMPTQKQQQQQHHHQEGQTNCETPPLPPIEVNSKQPLLSTGSDEATLPPTPRDYQNQQSISEYQESTFNEDVLSPRLPSTSSSNHLLLEAEDSHDKGNDNRIIRERQQQQRRHEAISLSRQRLLANTPAELPPLPPPHHNTPHSIYSIMCSCWATNPEERPQFHEIANRLFWCLQEPSILNTSLPSFYEL